MDVLDRHADRLAATLPFRFLARYRVRERTESTSIDAEKFLRRVDERVDQPGLGVEDEQESIDWSRCHGRRLLHLVVHRRSWQRTRRGVDCNAIKNAGGSLPGQFRGPFGNGSSDVHL